MKKVLFAFFAFVSLNLCAQPWKTVKGDGNLKKETREVTNFTSLASHGAIDVQISYGTSNSISVEADENLLQYIETTVDNGELIIKPKQNINLKSRSRMIVYVSMTTINSLSQSGSGNIKGDGEFSNDDKADIKVSGSGNIKLDFGTFHNIGLFVSGSGNIEMKGNTADNISATVAGSGNIDCSKVNCNEVNARISGSGNVRVSAEKTINAEISGSGNVFYKGDATDITSKISGSGKVIKI
ncbi:MAG TPA: head GIN domain-containing protein [Hanamia sp.]|nr:head GIN domain-containing protein [Hanamia sp.]